MKKLIACLLVILSANCYAQPSRQDKANMFGIIAITMAPSIFIYNGLDPKTDKPGRIFFGAMSGISLASGIAALTYSKPKNVLHYSLFFAAGVMDGFNEELQHHYPKVKEALPGINDQWWDPAISWNNKYTATYPFATTLLVGTTDAYHASRTLNKVFVLGGIFTFDKPKTFKSGLIKALAITVSYSAGKGLTHYIINK